MTKTRLICALLGVSLLTACASGMPIDQPPVGFAARSNFDAARLKSTTSVPVRAYIDQNGESTEVNGARCSAYSNEFTTSFTTPATVQFPVVKGRVSEMDISCRTTDAEGRKTLTPGRRTTVATSNNLTVLIVANIAAQAMSAAADRWQYVDAETTVRIGME